jgi:hypothetical protein
MMRFVAILIACTTPAAADVTGPNGRTIDCYCTDSEGLRVELGETICLVVDGRAFMAQCDMSLNVPMWRDTGSGCISSSLETEKSLSERLIQLAKPPV